MKLALAGIFAFLSGTCLWLFSLSLFGHREPFDGNVGRFVFLMTAIPLVAMAIGGIDNINKFWIWPLLVVFGELIGGMIVVGASPLMIIGLIFLIAFSLPGFMVCALAFLPMDAIRRSRMKTEKSRTERST